MFSPQGGIVLMINWVHYPLVVLIRSKNFYLPLQVEIEYKTKLRVRFEKYGGLKLEHFGAVKRKKQNHSLTAKFIKFVYFFVIKVLWYSKKQTI